jgi:hypothetical protein
MRSADQATALARSVQMREVAMGFSQDFVEKLALLILAAGISGLVIPLILLLMSAHKAKEQKVHEAFLARQAKVIDAQSKFLDDLSQALWTWRYLTIRVTYYGASDHQQEMFVTAKNLYDEHIWEGINQVRNEVSRSRRLVSEAAYRRLLTLYSDMVELDQQLSLCCNQPDFGRMESLHELNHLIFTEWTKRIDDTMDDLASELKLKGMPEPFSESERVAPSPAFVKPPAPRLGGGESLQLETSPK